MLFVYQLYLFNDIQFVSRSVMGFYCFKVGVDMIDEDCVIDQQQSYDVLVDFKWFQLLLHTNSDIAYLCRLAIAIMKFTYYECKLYFSLFSFIISYTNTLPSLSPMAKYLPDGLNFIAVHLYLYPYFNFTSTFVINCLFSISYITNIDFSNYCFYFFWFDFLLNIDEND